LDRVGSVIVVLVVEVRDQRLVLRAGSIDVVLPRQPDFNIIGLGSGKSQIAAAQRYHAVADTQFL
jgi:hypothetical protein